LFRHIFFLLHFSICFDGGSRLSSHHCFRLRTLDQILQIRWHDHLRIPAGPQLCRLRFVGPMFGGDILRPRGSLTRPLRRRPLLQRDQRSISQILSRYVLPLPSHGSLRNSGHRLFCYRYVKTIRRGNWSFRMVFLRLLRSRSAVFTHRRSLLQRMMRVATLKKLL